MDQSREEHLARLREENYAIEPGQKFEVDAFQPEDALGITRLYYAVYGETFPVDDVYSPETIVQNNQGNDLYQVVGRTSKGDIVGLYALFHSAPGDRIMEAGGWIVHPDYRGTSLALRLASKIHKNPPEHLGIDLIFGQCVCDHLTPQKLSKKFNAKFCALEIEPMPARPGKQAAYGRISLMDSIIPLKNRTDALYLPDRFDAQLREIYAWLGLDRTYLDNEAKEKVLATSPETEISVFPLGESDVAKIEVESVGDDFAEHLAEAEQQCPGMHTYHLLLPLSHPGCSAAAEAAHKAGFFFGGVLPLWFDRDALLMQKVAGTPDFSKPQILTEEGKRIMEMVQADWQALQAEKEER